MKRYIKSAISDVEIDRYYAYIECGYGSANSLADVATEFTSLLKQFGVITIGSIYPYRTHLDDLTPAYMINFAILRDDREALYNALDGSGYCYTWLGTTTIPYERVI